MIPFTVQLTVPVIRVHKGLASPSECVLPGRAKKRDSTFAIPLFRPRRDLRVRFCNNEIQSELLGELTLDELEEFACDLIDHI